MGWALDAALELILMIVPLLGIAATGREVVRSRPLAQTPLKSFAFLLGLLRITISDALLVLGGLEMGMAGFFGAYPSRGEVLANVIFCVAGLAAALFGQGRFRRVLSISSVLLASAWLREMTPLMRRFIGG
ncbi:MAG TPA: hypothetical protein VKU44_00690 [Terriglobia bacterium]|nr:hypothetical protein [Terriglobia bacterium]